MQTISLILIVLVVTACTAEPPRYRIRKFQQLRQRPQFFARQQLAPLPPSPYPSADELKPAIPFDEAVASQPDEIYGPPDQTYGPPEEDTNIEQLPSADSPLAFVPDPDVEEFIPATKERLRSRHSQSQRQRFQRLRVQQRPAAPSARLQAARPQQVFQQKTVVNSQRLVAAAAPAPQFTAVGFAPVAPPTAPPSSILPPVVAAAPVSAPALPSTSIFSSTGVIAASPVPAAPIFPATASVPVPAAPIFPAPASVPVAAAAPVPIESSIIAGIALRPQQQHYYVVNTPFSYAEQFQSW